MQNESTLSNLPAMAGKTIWERVKDVPTPKMEPEVLTWLEYLREQKIVMNDIHNTPCTETSSESVRSIEPVVSVCMTTYKHEKYLKRAIEGALAQKTDFPFELVISDDASPDRSPEIILEYQRLFPEKIRFLTSSSNIHGTGTSNQLRNLLACRGEFIAFCEGDDFWLDMFKLQKQKARLDKCPNAGVVYTGGYHLWSDSHRFVELPIVGLPEEVERPESLSGYLRNPNNNQHRTVSALFRTSLLVDRFKNDPLMYADLMLGDWQNWLYAASHSSICYITEPTCVYRKHSSSMTGGQVTNSKVLRDGALVKLFYLRAFEKETFELGKYFSIWLNLFSSKITLKTAGKNFWAKLWIQNRIVWKTYFDANLPQRLRRIAMFRSRHSILAVSTFFRRVMRRFSKRKARQFSEKYF